MCYLNLKDAEVCFIAIYFVDSEENVMFLDKEGNKDNSENVIKESSFNQLVNLFVGGTEERVFSKDIGGSQFLIINIPHYIDVFTAYNLKSFNEVHMDDKGNLLINWLFEDEYNTYTTLEFESTHYTKPKVLLPKDMNTLKKVLGLID